MPWMLRPDCYNFCMDQNELLKYAIAGLEAERAKIDILLEELKAQLNQTPTGGRRYAKEPAAPKKRSMSAAGRAAIRAALKKRWAEFHARKGASPKPAAKAAPKKKRTISKAQLEAMRKNAAKARAARAKIAAA